MPETMLICWSCGATLTGIPLPIGRREQCPHCTASLHACRQCVHYDPVANKACREPVADEVVDKEGGNFCDYYQLGGGPKRAPSAEAEQARAKLALAFGGSRTSPADRGGAAGGSRSASATSAPSSAEEARRKLDELFGKPKG
jgi:hypothetical protein